MKTAFQYAILPWIVALAIAPMPALAEDKPSLSAVYEIALDIDNDGKMDRAVLVSPESDGFYSPEKDWFMMAEPVDLYIYLGSGDEKLDLSRKPAFLKKDIAASDQDNNQLFPLESRKGSLIVNFAYNLFSNWAPETLTIVYRKGEFLVAGFTYSFDMESGDIAAVATSTFSPGKGSRQMGWARASRSRKNSRP